MNALVDGRLGLLRNGRGRRHDGHRGLARFWYRREIDFHRMNCWPQPFQHAERQLTRSL